MRSIFRLVLFLAFSLQTCVCFGEEPVEMQVLFRSISTADQVFHRLKFARMFEPTTYRMLKEGWYRSASILESFPNLTRYEDLSRYAGLRESFQQSVYQNERALGHIAFQLPKQQGELILGWMPNEQVNTPYELEALMKRVTSKNEEGFYNSFGGYFEDGKKWSKDPTYLAPLKRIKLHVSKDQVHDVIHNARIMTHDGQTKFQLYTAGKGFQPNCYNCATGTKEVLRRSGIEVPLLPHTGSPLALDSGYIETFGGDCRSAYYSLRSLSHSSK